MNWRPPLSRVVEVGVEVTDAKDDGWSWIDYSKTVGVVTGESRSRAFPSSPPFFFFVATAIRFWGGSAIIRWTGRNKLKSSLGNKKRSISSAWSGS